MIWLLIYNLCFVKVNLRKNLRFFIAVTDIFYQTYLRIRDT